MTRLFNTDGSSLLAALTNRQSNVRQLPLSKGMLLKEGWSGQLSPRSWKWRFWYLMKRFPHLSQRLWAPYKFSEDKKSLTQTPTSWREQHHFKSEDYSPLWTDEFPCSGGHFTQEDNGRKVSSFELCCPAVWWAVFHVLRLERYS